METVVLWWCNRCLGLHIWWVLGVSGAHVASWLLSASAVEEEVSGTPPQRCDWTVRTVRPALLCSALLCDDEARCDHTTVLYILPLYILKGTLHPLCIPSYRLHRPSGAICLWRDNLFKSRTRMLCVENTTGFCRKCLQQILQWFPPLRLCFILVVQNMAQRRRPRLQLVVIF